MTTSIAAEFQRCLARYQPPIQYRVSTTTWTSRWIHAPPNIATILALDTATFQKSRFCKTAYDFKPFRETLPRIRCRLYPSSQKIVVTGCVSEVECTDAIDRVCLAMGGAISTDPECHLININIDLPWTLNRYTLAGMHAVPNIRLVEVQEGHPAVILHVDIGTRIKKAMVYAGAGKVSLHAASWRDACTMWETIAPVIESCRGITKSVKS